MRVALLLPSALSSRAYGQDKIFAPGDLAVKLADGLVERGHQVIMYASRDVQTKAKLVAGDHLLTDQSLTYFQFSKEQDPDDSPKTREVIMRDFEYDLTLKAYQDGARGALDLIHSFCNFGAHYFHELNQFPTVYTLHEPLPIRENTIEYRRLVKFSHHPYISVSHAQRQGIVKLNFIATVFNGCDVEDFPFNGGGGETLIHFGRLLEEKGTHEAIEVAEELQIPLAIASQVPTAGRAKDYYDRQVATQLDRKLVTQVGLLRGEAKAAYIGRAKAFILPLAWEEPFGLAMVEAMACGTPVIVYNRGSASEIVRDGVTGFIVESVEKNSENRVRPLGNLRSDPKWIIKKRGIAGLVEAVRRIGEIDRRACRRHIEENFTVERMVQNYENVYQTLLKR